MRLSRVMTIHPLLPASESQVSSSVPFGRCAVRRSTNAPAALSAAAIESLSSDSSRKRTSGSGGFELELAADGVPDGFFLGTVFFRQQGHRISGLELLGQHGGRDSRPRDDRPAERHSRIDDHGPRLLPRGLRAHERIKLDRQALRVAVYPLEIGAYQIRHFDLAVLRDVDDLAQVLDEDV